MKAKIGILMVGYDRPQHFRRAVRFLRQVPDDVPVIASFDRCDDASVTGEMMRDLRSASPLASTFVQKTRKGCNRHILESLAMASESMEDVVYVEDDCILPESGFRLLETMMDSARKADPRIHSVQAWRYNLEKHREELEDVLAEDESSNLWGILLDSAAVKSILSRAGRYLEACGDGVRLSDEASRRICGMVSEISRDGRPATPSAASVLKGKVISSWDCFANRCMLADGLVRASCLLPRLENPGVDGFHARHSTHPCHSVKYQEWWEKVPDKWRMAEAPGSPDLFV